MKISGIYRIANKINGKQYIGSSVNIEKRWKCHCSLLHKNKHHSPYLQNAWNKYGKESFSFELLWKCEPDELLYEEQLALNNIKCEYNTCIIAGSTLGVKLSIEARMNMSTVQKGKKHSASARINMSIANKGRKKPPRTAEHRAKLSAARKIAVKAVADDGAVLHFSSMLDVRKSGFDLNHVRTAIKTGTKYRGLLWIIQP